MKRLIYIFCVLSVLACGTVPAMVKNQPESAIFQGQISTAAPKPTNTPLSAVLGVSGCWNIRSAPMVAAEIVRVQCDGVIKVFGAVQNGFVRVEDGYICNQAVGDNRECK